MGREKVSILVFVEFTSRQKLENQPTKSEIVSILVFVEFTSRLEYSLRFKKAKNSFNPCFRGVYFSTLNLTKD
ncbi:hypothetical protein [Methanosarcina barkeri]